VCFIKIELEIAEVPCCYSTTSPKGFGGNIQKFVSADTRKKYEGLGV
jgi:Na+-translocating ferredoxin:NAD+ oxidoreductase RnfG subunit